MIVVDTNVLVAASVTGHEHHAPASAWLRKLAAAGAPWAVPSPAVAEFTRVLTHPRVYRVAHGIAARALEQLLALPGARLLPPGEGFAEHFLGLLRAGLAAGNGAFDAQIAAICLEGGHALLSGDGGFSRFPGLRTLPLLAAPFVASR